MIMDSVKKAPFRANHVGSLLRPPELRQAREKYQNGEFRRNLWHADFLKQFDGIKVVEGLLPESARHFQSSDSDVQRSPTQFVVSGKLGHPRGIETENFRFLASVTKKTPKQCIPSPSLVHFRTGRGG